MHIGYGSVTIKIHKKQLVGMGWREALAQTGCGLDLNPFPSTRRCLDSSKLLQHYPLATLMLANGENPKIVNERLGHANIDIAMDRYSHVTATLQREAADRLDTLMNCASQ